MVLFRVLVTPSVLLLSVIVILQTIVYSIIQDVKFLMRHLAMIGALCLLLAEHQHRAQKKKEKTASPGLPILDQSRPKDALQLFGRIFLVLLFCTLLHFRFLKNKKMLPKFSMIFRVENFYVFSAKTKILKTKSPFQMDFKTFSVSKKK